jgi:NhaP-type Na+/H+ or K+/H+ antiporter
MPSVLGSLQPGSVPQGPGSLQPGCVLHACATGAGVAFLASYMVKTKYFRSEHLPLESCLVVLLAYCSYLLADALHLSGIVAVLFCGEYLLRG